MSYYTKTHRKEWKTNKWIETGHLPMVAHNDCLPDDQFEIIGSEKNPLRHQREPWFWNHVYGGMLAVEEGKMDFDSPWHLCHYCKQPVP